MNLKRLACSYYVADQLRVEDLGILVARGIKSVVNNRPDGEETDQPSNASLAAAAERAGLTYRYVPVRSKNVTEAEQRSFVKALDGLPGPICGFCRTGTRAAICWALSEVGKQSSYSIAEAVIGAGYPSEDVELQLGLKSQQMCRENNHAN